MNITTDFDGGLEFQEDGLSDEDFPSFGAQEFDFVFRKIDGFAGSVSSYYLRQRMSVRMSAG